MGDVQGMSGVAVVARLDNGMGKGQQCGCGLISMGVTMK